MSVNQDEAAHFVKNVLRVDDTGNGNKLALLNKIIYGFKSNVPCHNIALLSSKARQLPDWNRVKSDILNGKGELGCALNVFMAGLLKALGFDASLSTAVMYALDAFHSSHLIVLVGGLGKPGEQFLVDVGNEHPTLEAVPLGFGEESPEYHHSYLEYKFMCREGRILRLHNRGQHDSKAQIDASLDGFYIFYDFDLLSKTQEDLDNCLSLIYTNPRASPFHKSLRASVFRNGMCILLKDNELYVENEEHKMIPRPLTSNEELTKAFTDYFPMIDVELISKARETLKMA